MKNIWKVLSLPETMLGDFLFKPGCIIFLVDDGRRWVTGDGKGLLGRGPG